MKIMHIDAFTGFGGGQKRYLNICQTLKKNNNDLLLITRNNSKVSKYFPGKVYTAPFMGDLDIISFFKILFIVIKEKPDIIHTHSHHDHWHGGLVAKLFSKIKLIHTRHVDFPIENNFINKFIFNNLTDFIITSCESIKKTLIKSFPKIKDFNNKIESVLTLNIPDKWGKSKKVRKEFNIEDKIVVSMITRFVKWKGHRYLLEAISIIIEEINNIVFILAGKGPEHKNIKNKAKEMGIDQYIIFTGFRDDVEDIYADTDISVLPSEMESPGVSIAESIFHETPVVTSNTGGIPEIVEDGFNGFLVDVGDYKAIAENVIKLSKNKKLYKKIKNNCKRWKNKIMEDKKPGEKVEEIYHKILR